MLRLGLRIFTLWPGKLCPSRDDANGRGCAAEVRQRFGGSVATKIAGADGAGCSRGAWTAPPPLAYLGLDRAKTMSTTRGGRAEPCHASIAPGAAGRIPTAPGSARTAGPS